MRNLACFLKLTKTQLTFLVTVDSKRWHINVPGGSAAPENRDGVALKKATITKS